MKYIISLLVCFMISCATPSYDIIINNGEIADGSGGDLIYANLYIRNGKIVLVGDQPNATAFEIIDATGLCPIGYQFEFPNYFYCEPLPFLPEFGHLSDQYLPNCEFPRLEPFLQW